MPQREPPKLPHPSTTPRIHASGRQQRDRPIYRQHGGEGKGQWEVEVTPLRDTTHVGRGIDAGRIKPRAVFEVRAAYFGPGLAEFDEARPLARVVPTTHTEDEELALAIARTFELLLRRGERDLNLVQICEDVERRRA